MYVSESLQASVEWIQGTMEPQQLKTEALSCYFLMTRLFSTSHLCIPIIFAIPLHSFSISQHMDQVSWESTRKKKSSHLSPPRRWAETSVASVFPWKFISLSGFSFNDSWKEKAGQREYIFKTQYTSHSVTQLSNLNHYHLKLTFIRAPEFTH